MAPISNATEFAILETTLKYSPPRLWHTSAEARDDEE
jgi:hypothetical protein